MRQKVLINYKNTKCEVKKKRRVTINLTGKYLVFVICPPNFGNCKANLDTDIQFIMTLL